MYRVRLKKITGILHLWLGLASGLVVFVVSFTGAMLTFEEEIERHVISPHLYYVDPDDSPRHSIENLMKLASPELLKLRHGSKASRIFLYKETDRSAIVGFNYNDSNGENHRGHVFINPYTGGILGSRTGNPHHDIWNTITSLHIELMLGEAGNFLVKWGTIVFLFMVISGIVLWWPKNKQAARQRAWFRWKQATQWKRKNYDLHNILGFYACWIVIFLIITGAMWAFEWFNEGVYYITSGGKNMQTSFSEAIRPQDLATQQTYPIIPAQYQIAYDQFCKAYPEITLNATEISVGYFADEKEKLMDVSASFDPKGLRGNKNIWAFFDKSTNQMASDNWAGVKNLGDAIQMSTNEIHYGSFFGMTSRIATFLACLIAASLPVSGFYIWYGRKNKKKRKPHLAIHEI